MEPAPIDEIADLTLPAGDPRLAAKAETGTDQRPARFAADGERFGPAISELFYDNPRAGDR